MHSLGTIGAMVAALCLLASPARSAPPQDPATVAEVERLAAEAAQHYKAKRYAEAVALYVKAYQLGKLPELLYNIAFIYDSKLGERELAIEYYRLTVSTPEVDSKLVAKAVARLEELKTAKAAEPEPQPTPARRTERAPPDHTAAYVLIGGGALIATTGLVLGAVASGTDSEFVESKDLAQKKALRDEGQTQALVGDILMATGLVAVSIGVVMRVTGGAEGSGSVDVGAASVPGGAAVSLRGAF